MTVHHDLDLLNHPELDGEVHRAVVAEHTKAHEDYKNEMLPKVAHLIRDRCKAAREEAIRCYCEKKGLHRHHVMAKRNG